MADLCVLRYPTDSFQKIGPQLGSSRIEHSNNFNILPKFRAVSKIAGMQSTRSHVAFGSAKPAQFAKVAQQKTEVSSENIASTHTRSSADFQHAPSISLSGESSDDAGSPVASTPLSDAEVESLVKRVNESVVIRNMPIQNPQWIQVPKGYLMDLELQPSEFFESRSNSRDLLKKRKRETSLPNWTTRGWQNRIQGFRPEEVNWNGALCMDNCQDSNLTNEIHPLFDRSCFDDTPDAIYDQLIPALRLATLFLTQPICMQFWVTLAMGFRKDDPEMSTRNGKRSQRINTHVELTLERAKIVITHLRDVGNSKLIHYRFNRGLMNLDSTAYAVSLPICDYKGLDGECHNVKGSLVRSVIRFHADYYVAAKKLSQLKFQEVSQKLRFSFGFAVLIVHEIAHSIEGIHFRGRDHQWLDWHSSQYYKEPYWLDWNESECGRAWEETMFGGHIQPTNRKVDGSHGIAVADWPFGGKEENPREYRWFTISMDYIEHMFQRSTWQRKFDLKDWRIFNIPRDGATSLYLNSFSTMNPSEEERVAIEEKAEALARLKEEPAPKKRERALGEAEEKRSDQDDVVELAEESKPEAPSGKSIQRRASMTTGTRKFSLVKPHRRATLDPNATYRPMLIPQSRKASAESESSTNSPKAGIPGEKHPRMTYGLRPTAIEGLTPQQQTFLRDQRQKDLKRSMVDNAKAKGLSSQPPKEIKPKHGLTKRHQSKEIKPNHDRTKPVKPRLKGILQRHKQKRQAIMLRRRALSDNKSAEEVRNTESGTVNTENVGIAKGDGDVKLEEDGSRADEGEDQSYGKVAKDVQPDLE
ncbi:hypothetical protein ACLMJK_003920 [Lecanora helva]